MYFRSTTKGAMSTFQPYIISKLTQDTTFHYRKLYSSQGWNHLCYVVHVISLCLHYIANSIIWAPRNKETKQYGVSHLHNLADLHSPNDYSLCWHDSFTFIVICNL